MSYSFLASADLRLWHPTLTVEEFERACRTKSTTSHSKGMRSPYGDRTEYRDNYCSMEIVARDVHDPHRIIIKCLNLIGQLIKAEPQFRETGGRVWIILKIYDPEFLQITLNLKQMSELLKYGAAICFENQNP